jgi:AMIN domain
MPLAFAQTQLKSVRMLTEKHGDDNGPEVEIVTSAPVIPDIQQLDNPPRLVFDLPNTTVTPRQQRIPGSGTVITAIRVDQHQDSPPVARVVLDMRANLQYAAESVGNRLVVKFPGAGVENLHPVPPNKTLAPALADLTTFNGNPVPVGSSLSAGSDAATLHLARGGEVRVCPGTTLSVTPSQNGREMTLGMSTGTLETHYALQSSADSVLTPDFRILLSGPGEFDFAISADAHGNTCVRALAGNTASAVVSELMGNETYQVKPTEQAMFHLGRINGADANVPATCGCSAPVAPHTIAGPESTPLPLSKPDDVHVTVEAPFVFRGDEAPIVAAGPSRKETQSLPVTTSRRLSSLPDVVVPPPPSLSPVRPKAATPAPPKTFFGRVRRFFGAIFR